jgi:hypothetical protein
MVTAGQSLLKLILALEPPSLQGSTIQHGQLGLWCIWRRPSIQVVAAVGMRESGVADAHVCRARSKVGLGPLFVCSRYAANF